MKLCKFTSSSDGKPVYINAAHVALVTMENKNTVIMTLARASNGAVTATVKEPLEAVVATLQAS